jgi:hypothetical protein
MDFVSRTLVQLADPTARAALFDQVSLEQITATSYDLDLLTIEAPFSVVFEKLELGFSLQQGITLDGSWQPAGILVEAHFQVYGLPANNQAVSADAYWHGGIVARVSNTITRITAVTSNWRNLLAIDAEIINDLGALPQDAATLEQERRARLISMLSSTMAQPAALTDHVLDTWLANNQAQSVSHLLTNIAHNRYPNQLRIAITEEPAQPSSPLFLPISAALFIRPADFLLSQLLTETKQLLSVIRKAGLDPARDAMLPVRHSVIAIWIVPSSSFDDADWTGATDSMTPEQRRTARRLTAGEWLAAEGIGLVAIADS